MSEISNIIKNGESQTVEFKQSFDKEAIETISAFANTDGGILIIGVSDKGIIIGVTISGETLCAKIVVA